MTGIMVRFLGRGRNILFSTESKLPLGSTIQSPVRRVSRAMTLGVKQLGHEADHPPLLLLLMLRLKMYSGLFPNLSSRLGA
jgi:hypothetical protein